MEGGRAWERGYQTLHAAQEHIGMEIGYHIKFCAYELCRCTYVCSYVCEGYYKSIHVDSFFVGTFDWWVVLYRAKVIRTESTSCNGHQVCTTYIKCI